MANGNRGDLKDNLDSDMASSGDPSQTGKFSSLPLPENMLNQTTPSKLLLEGLPVLFWPCLVIALFHLTVAIGYTIQRRRTMIRVDDEI